MPRRWLLASVSALAIFVAAVAWSQPPTEVSFPPDEAVREILVERLGEQVDRIGIVIGMIAPEERRVVTSGSAGAGDSRPLDGETVFEIGSITKVFTALLMADMEARGELHREDPIERYLPASVRVPERGGRLITLADLANHRSGLPRLPPNMGNVDPENPYASYSVEQLYQFLSDHELQRDIGSRYEYSNVGVGLLGHVLSLAAGEDYEALLLERIAEPLGMTSTRIALSPDMRSRLAQGHDERLNETPLWDLPTLAGAGALRSTANDLLTFLALHLGHEDSPLKSAADSLLITRWSTPGNAEIALGWHVVPRDTGVIVTHDGGTGGYRASVAYDPIAGRGVVALTNRASAGGVNDLALHLLDPSLPLLPADSPLLEPPRERTEITLSTDLLESYAGEYELAPGVRLSITRQGTQLLVQVTGQPAVEIYPETETEFFHRVVDVQIEFQTDAQGRVNGLLLHQFGTRQLARRLDTDADPPQEWFGRREAVVDPDIYDRYVGTYRLAPGVTATVTRDGDRLMAQLTGQPQVEVFPESEVSFFYKNVDAAIVFEMGDGDTATALTLHQSGREVRAPRD